jgi:hypothetical protein
MKLLLVPDIYQIHQSGLDRFNNTKDLGELRIAEVLHAIEAGGLPSEPRLALQGLPVPEPMLGVGVNARVRGADRPRPNGSGRGHPVSLREQDRAWAA